MTKIETSDKLVDSFGGIDFFRAFIKENHSAINEAIQSNLGSRPKQAKYSNMDVLITFMSNCLVGGAFVEDFHTLKQRTSSGHFEKFCSPDTFCELMSQFSEHRNVHTVKDVDKGKFYNFCFNEKLNDLLIDLAYEFDSQNLSGDIIDHDHTKIRASKADSKICYKGNGYYASVFSEKDTPLYVSMQDGNAVPAKELSTILDAGLRHLGSKGRKFKIFRADGASYSAKVIDTVLSHCPYYVVRAKRSDERQKALCLKNCEQRIINPAHKPLGQPNHHFLVIEHKDNFAGRPCRRIYYSRVNDSAPDLFSEISFHEIITNLPEEEYPIEKVIKMYQQRGASERLFDELKNDYNAAHPPMSGVCYNLSCLIISCISKVIITAFKRKMCALTKGYIKTNYRLKRITMKIIALPAVLVSHARRKIYRIFCKDKRIDSIVQWANLQ